MLVFKTSKREQLLQGRTIKYLSGKVGYSEIHICNILKGKSNCSNRFAEKLLEVADKGAKIEKYFKEV